eukprot:350292_1
MSNNSVYRFYYLYLFCITVILSQCDHYIKSRPMKPHWVEVSSDDEILMFTLNLTINRCLPQYSNFKSLIGFSHYHGGGQSNMNSGRFARDRNKSKTYSQCDFNSDLQTAVTCDDSNCLNATNFEQRINFGYYNDTCYDSYNNSINYKRFGYYAQPCGLRSNDTMFYKLECKCNNTYSLSIYVLTGTSKTCLFKMSLIYGSGDREEIKQYIFDKIDCNYNECTDLDSLDIMNDYMDRMLWSDSQCTKDCTFSSSTCASTTASSDDEWFMVAITFIVLFVVVAAILGYFAWVLYSADEKATESGKEYQQTAGSEVEANAALTEK